MYRAMDCLASWKGVIYFMSMIFLVAWLVKVSNKNSVFLFHEIPIKT